MVLAMRPVVLLLSINVAAGYFQQVLFHDDTIRHAHAR
jgi:hypothetical protein